MPTELRPDQPQRSRESGFSVVFWQQMRSRCPKRDLIWTFVLVLVNLAMGYLLMNLLFPVAMYSGVETRLPLRWMRMSALSAPILWSLLAVILGTYAVPGRDKFVQTQAALLTNLTPMDIVLGRLLASLWPLSAASLLSLALCWTVQVVWRPLPDGWQGYTAIAMAVLVIDAFALMIGSVGFLAAMERRPGRNSIRGMLVSLAVAVFCITGLFLLNGVFPKFNDPTLFINSVLFLNPSTAATSALDLDVLRMDRFYDYSVVPQYPFLYPPALATAVGYLVVAGICAWIASLMLRRAYR